MTLKIPNEQHFPMTTMEIADVVLKAGELKDNGQIEEAERLRSTIPVRPDVAKVMKDMLGIEYMLSKNANLYRAIIEYGEEFLEP